MCNCCPANITIHSTCISSALVMWVGVVLGEEEYNESSRKGTKKMLGNGQEGKNIMDKYKNQPRRDGRKRKEQYSIQYR